MKLTEEKLIEIIESVFKQKKRSVLRDTMLENVAKDSMDIMEFIAILENTYGIHIEPPELAKLQSVGEVIDYLLKMQKVEN